MSKKIFWFGAYSFLIIIACVSLACGSNDAVSTASPEQYKEIALRYLHAVAKGDYDTFVSLDHGCKSSLEVAKSIVAPEPAFDRQKRLQSAINSAMNRNRFLFQMLLDPGNFSGPKVSSIRNANLRALEVTPFQSLWGGQQATVYVEAKGGQTNILWVTIVNIRGDWNVTNWDLYRR